MTNEDLILALAEFSSDPVGFAYFAFEWGKGELAQYEGLDAWQEAILRDLGNEVITVAEAIALANEGRPIQFATTSGHGIGKSALVAIIILWAISTFEDTKGVVTANTENQLKTKTWAEVAKWHRRFIGRELFKLTATSLFSVDPAHEKTWRIDMVAWSERNTEAFAGLHNASKRILVVFDEGSAIPDIIYEVTEGALTDRDAQIIWLVFGNPTRNKGRFRECFDTGRFAHRWNSRAIDSREVKITNKEQIARWVADYGEDSDFVRVRVRGVFPRVDAESFISYDLCRDATDREWFKGHGPLILGVDVGRFGDDPSVIFPRQGTDARSRPPIILQGADTMATAARVASEFLALKADMVMVDSGGVGGGVVDRLRQLRIPVMEVDFGSKPLNSNPDDGARYANRRAEIWGATRSWLATGCIPHLQSGENTTLVDELSGPNFFLNSKEAIQLESKSEMRSRGVPSPNVADALACTFAYPVFFLGDRSFDAGPLIETEYDPFSKERIYG